MYDQICSTFHQGSKVTLNFNHWIKKIKIKKMKVRLIKNILNGSGVNCMLISILSERFVRFEGRCLVTHTR